MAFIYYLTHIHLDFGASASCRRSARASASAARCW